MGSAVAVWRLISEEQKETEKKVSMANTDSQKEMEVHAFIPKPSKLHYA